MFTCGVTSPTGAHNNLPPAPAAYGERIMCPLPGGGGVHHPQESLSSNTGTTLLIHLGEDFATFLKDEISHKYPRTKPCLYCRGTPDKQRLPDAVARRATLRSGLGLRRVREAHDTRLGPRHLPSPLT